MTTARLPQMEFHELPCNNVQNDLSVAPEKVLFLEDLDKTLLSHFSRVQLFVTLWTIAHQAPLSMRFSRQEYWSGLPCPPPGDLPDPGMETVSLVSPALAGGLFTTWASLVAQMVKNLPAIRETWARFLAGKIPWSRKWKPTLVFLPGESHGQRSLSGYSPWDHKESDMTERLTFHLDYH